MDEIFEILDPGFFTKPGFFFEYREEDFIFPSDSL